MRKTTIIMLVTLVVILLPAVIAQFGEPTEPTWITEGYNSPQEKFNADLTQQFPGVTGCAPNTCEIKGDMLIIKSSNAMLPTGFSGTARIESGGSAIYGADVIRGPATITQGTLELESGGEAKYAGYTVKGPATRGSDGIVTLAENGEYTTTKGVMIVGPAGIFDSGKRINLEGGLISDNTGNTYAGVGFVDNDAKIIQLTKGYYADKKTKSKVTVAEGGKLTYDDNKKTMALEKSNVEVADKKYYADNVDIQLQQQAKSKKGAIIGTAIQVETKGELSEFGGAKFAQRTDIKVIIPQNNGYPEWDVSGTGDMTGLKGDAIINAVGRARLRIAGAYPDDYVMTDGELTRKGDNYLIGKEDSGGLLEVNNKFISAEGRTQLCLSDKECDALDYVTMALDGSYQIRKHSNAEGITLQDANTGYTVGVGEQISKGKIKSGIVNYDASTDRFLALGDAQIFGNGQELTVKEVTDDNTVLAWASMTDVSATELLSVKVTATSNSGTPTLSNNNAAEPVRSSTSGTETSQGQTKKHLKTSPQPKVNPPPQVAETPPAAASTAVGDASSVKPQQRVISIEGTANTPEGTVKTTYREERFGDISEEDVAQMRSTLGTSERFKTVILTDPQNKLPGAFRGKSISCFGAVTRNVRSCPKAKVRCYSNEKNEITNCYNIE